jgi:hypothetical protein
LHQAIDHLVGTLKMIEPLLSRDAIVPHKKANDRLIMQIAVVIVDRSASV